MAFFSAKNAGLAFMIAACLSVIAAVALVVMAVMDVDVEEIKSHEMMYFVIVAIGDLIAACMYFAYGKKVRDGAISRKIDILAEYVKIVGIVQIVGGICGAVASFLDGGELGATLINAIGFIVLGLIIIFISTKINDGKQTTGDKIIWIILLLLFAIGLILSVLEIISLVLIISGICDLIIYSFMILLLTDEEVKKEMNI